MESVPAFELRAAGAVHEAPLSVERETRMSRSVPIVPPTFSLEPQTTTQLPAPSVVTCGLKSPPESVAALVLRAAGAVQVAPLLVERETRISRSVPIVPPRLSLESHTAIQLPAPSLVTCGYSS